MLVAQTFVCEFISIACFINLSPETPSKHMIENNELFLPDIVVIKQDFALSGA